MLAHKVIEKYLSDNNVDYFAYERYGVDERNPYHLINIPLDDGTDVLFKISFNYNSTDVYDETKYRLSIYNDLSGRMVKSYSNNNLSANDILRKVMRYKDRFKIIGGDETIKESVAIGICGGDIRSMVGECVKRLLNEDQTSKSISAAIKLIMDKEGRTHEDAEQFVRVNIRNTCPILRTDAASKFILGVTRLYLEHWLWGPEAGTRLNRALKIISSDERINEFDRNLNGLSLPSLLYIVKDEAKKSMNDEMAELNGVKFDRTSNYKVIRIKSFNSARKYSKYTDWCITHDEDMFDYYTADGLNQFYFCLRDDFMDCNKIAGKNCPLDDYGLSMIAVCVDGEGFMASSTCRWNHDNGGSENILSVMDISKLIGRNFYTVFKPNNNWKSRIENIKKVLSSGKYFDPTDIFDEMHYEKCGYTVVLVGNKYNYLSENNELMFDEWFETAEDFEDNGYAKVSTYYGFNLIDKNCNFVFNTWYDHVTNFDGPYNLAIAVKNSKMNYLKKDGTTLSKKWYDVVSNFNSKGVARVFDHGLGWNIINSEGDLVCDQWYDGIKLSISLNLSTVNKNGKFNFIDNDTGKPLFRTWFDEIIRPFSTIYQGYQRARVIYYDANLGEKVTSEIDPNGNVYFENKIIGKIE